MTVESLNYSKSSVNLIYIPRQAGQPIIVNAPAAGISFNTEDAIGQLLPGVRTLGVANWAGHRAVPVSSVYASILSSPQPTLAHRV
jgi:hypothetical protein